MKGGTLKYYGVANLRGTKKWQAQVNKKYLGCYASEELAAEAVYFHLKEAPDTGEGRQLRLGENEIPMPTGVQKRGDNQFCARYRGKVIGTFPSRHEAAKAYQLASQEGNAV
eukprot:CAMPEP_0115520186 /NCGR_PEP_ID=MMETSP0271-20121206/78844_1 /TAXON_ID=71861 /ORGANISM="Scrippsiella trochoidea, Strain CCMP3099" /LENGTH=111 /DNA_ID=CAMNT_0002951265 /DNA_START=1 /DNA_END=332 /DNA_ORIENTATION=+